MLKIEFSREEIEALHYQRFHHPHPRVQLKMEVVYLKSQDLPHQEICRLTRLTGNTVRAYLRQYHEGGLQRLKQVDFHQPHSQLMSYRESLEQHLNQHPPATIKQARAMIAQQTGIERSPTQIREFLLKLGIKCRKVGQIPANADPEQQANFLEQELRPRLQQAEAGERTVFFLDAAHFVLSPFLGFLWSAVRLFLPAPSGRQRFNVLSRTQRHQSPDRDRDQPDLHHLGARL